MGGNDARLSTGQMRPRLALSHSSAYPHAATKYLSLSFSTLASRIGRWHEEAKNTMGSNSISMKFRNICKYSEETLANRNLQGLNCESSENIFEVWRSIAQPSDLLWRQSVDDMDIALTRSDNGVVNENVQPDLYYGSA